MVNKEEVMPIFIKNCPSFNKVWTEHLNDIWDRTSETILYTDFSALARHAINLLKMNDLNELTNIFDTAEMLLFHGDKFVKEAVEVGLLEDIQNLALGESIKLSCFDSYLGEHSKKAWSQLIVLWEGK